VSAASAANKQAGLLIRDATEIPRRAQQGFTYLAVQSDLAILHDGFRALIERARPALS
jgi:2-dehydro-3-deoxyglucarate aldolase/4-hydroxy-2-oxoheptanedioate aldolase